MTRRYFTPLALALMLAAAGCGGGEPAEQTELTRAQKDSIVADLPIPGASAVGGAMEARDRANARTAQHDSIGNRP
jgi:hypothetical protein